MSCVQYTIMVHVYNVNTTCTQAFHPLCCALAGLKMEVREMNDEVANEINVMYNMLSYVVM